MRHVHGHNTLQSHKAPPGKQSKHSWDFPLWHCTNLLIIVNNISFIIIIIK